MDVLLARGVPTAMVDELVAAVMRVNYNQNVESMHAFVGGVSLAGNAEDLWAVQDGNNQVHI